MAICRSGTDTKWGERSSLLTEIFRSAPANSTLAEDPLPYGAGDIASPKPSPRQKLVIFTEHRDTLNYLAGRIRTQLGRENAFVLIHGSVGREDRLKVQEVFRHDPDVNVLLATDAAGEGINLQRDHLMINYDRYPETRQAHRLTRWALPMPVAGFRRLLIHGDWLIVEARADEGTLLAFERSTGKQVWRSDAKGPAGHTGGHSPDDDRKHSVCGGDDVSGIAGHSSGRWL